MVTYKVRKRGVNKVCAINVPSELITLVNQEMQAKDLSFTRLLLLVTQKCFELALKKRPPRKRGHLLTAKARRIECYVPYEVKSSLVAEAQAKSISLGQALVVLLCRYFRRPDLYRASRPVGRPKDRSYLWLAGKAAKAVRLP